MFRKILVANRGEIAVRIIRAARGLGVPTVAVFSTADREALHVRMADERVCIGPPSVEESYLNIPAIIGAALTLRADAIHPGYGFLSENGDFAEACQSSGITFIGPRVRAIRLMGDKPRARKMMARAEIPVLSGSVGAMNNAEEAKKVARDVGYPVLLKAAAGGGCGSPRATPSSSACSRWRRPREERRSATVRSTSRSTSSEPATSSSRSSPTSTSK